MRCTNRDIKELLAAAQEQKLEAGELRRVEDHLDRCEDCRAEADLLRIMAAEPVHDPGEAFWATMPERVSREVHRQKEHAPEVRRRLAGVLSGLLLLPRWAGVAAATLLVATVTWFAVSRGPLETEKQIASAPYEYLDQEPDAVTGAVLQGLSGEELQTVEAWADAGFSAIGREAAEVRSENVTLNEELSYMSTREMDRFSRMLDAIKQEG